MNCEASAGELIAILIFFHLFFNVVKSIRIGRNDYKIITRGARRIQGGGSANGFSFNR